MEFLKLILPIAFYSSTVSSPEEEEFHNSSMMDHPMSRALLACSIGSFNAERFQVH